MKLDHDEAMSLLLASYHGTLCTVDPIDGVHAAPCVFAVDADGYVGIPIDLVKPKATLKLKCERNLDVDPRASLLIEQWDADDWSQLWWVRASMRRHPEAASDRIEALADQLENHYVQYQGKPFVRIEVLQIVDIVGWAGRSA